MSILSVLSFLVQVTDMILIGSFNERKMDLFRYNTKFSIDPQPEYVPESVPDQNRLKYYVDYCAWD